MLKVSKLIGGRLTRCCLTASGSRAAVSRRRAGRRRGTRRAEAASERCKGRFKGCAPDGEAGIGGQLVHARLGARKDLARALDLELHEAPPPIVDAPRRGRKHAVHHLHEQNVMLSRRDAAAVPLVHRRRHQSVADSALQLRDVQMVPHELLGMRYRSAKCRHSATHY